MLKLKFTRLYCVVTLAMWSRLDIRFLKFAISMDPLEMDDASLEERLSFDEEKATGFVFSLKNCSFYIFQAKSDLFFSLPFW